MSSCSNVCANEKGLKLFDNSYRFEGPMLHNYRCYRQIRQIKFNGLIFSIVPGDNCVKIGNVVGLIRNIVVKNDDVKLFFESFRKRENFFEDPLQSSYVGIFYVSSLSGNLQDISLGEIDCKYVMLPYKFGYVVIPLITTVLSV